MLPIYLPIYVYKFLIWFYDKYNSLFFICKQFDTFSGNSKEIICIWDFSNREIIYRYIYMVMYICIECVYVFADTQSYCTDCNGIIIINVDKNVLYVLSSYVSPSQHWDYWCFPTCWLFGHSFVQVFIQMKWNSEDRGNWW